MPRLTEKNSSALAPQTAASIPELPNFAPELVAQPGGLATNAALQRWWDLVRRRIEFNANDQRRFNQITAGFTSNLASLQAQITHEETVRADADSALATSVTTLEATVNGVSASVTTIASALATIDGYLEGRWTVNVTAGNVVTGITLFSSSGPDTDVSYVAFQADKFLVNTSAGNRQIFSATASEIKLGNVLTVDLANAKIFSGTGTFQNSATPFYSDSVGNFSIRDKFSYNNATNQISIFTVAGGVGGWTINPFTITAGSAILDSSGQLILGTSNDIIYISAIDSTYRIWVGSATSGSAAFRVTKTGTMTAENGVFSGIVTATGGAIGGFAIGSSTLSATGISLDSSAPSLQISGVGLNTILIDPTTGLRISNGALSFTTSAGGGVAASSWSSSGGAQINVSGSSITLKAATGNPTMTFGFGSTTETISLTSSAGAPILECATFSGGGSGLTSLNGSNIASGTVAPARLGSGSGGSSKFLREDSSWQTISTSVAWGGITGTLSSQTDLQSALDAKLAITTLNGYFNDPSTNGSFTAANWITDLGLATSATTDTTNASNISSGTLGRPVTTSIFTIAGTSVDALDVNIRALVSGSPVVVLNKDLPGVTINGSQIIGTRKTGWSAATGSATRTSYDTTSVTTEQLAERVKALIDDFISHGAIGS